MCSNATVLYYIFTIFLTCIVIHNYKSKLEISSYNLKRLSIIKPPLKWIKAVIRENLLASYVSYVYYAQLPIHILNSTPCTMCTYSTIKFKASYCLVLPFHICSAANKNHFQLRS